MAEITAARITNLHERIKLILGSGAGPNGYGQIVESNPVSNQGAFILAEDINSIYRDMINVRTHQIGIGSSEIAQVLQNRNVIADDTSFFVNDNGEQSVDNILFDTDGNQVTDPLAGTLKGISDFERLMTSIEADKFLIDIATQGTLESSITDRLTLPWNGIRTQELSVTFADADHRRHFFNTGGEIRFSASITGAVVPKGLDWAALLSSIGTVSFSYSTTTSTGAGSGSLIGNYDLTTAYQQIFQKIGSGTINSIYNGNIYTIRARFSALNPNVIVFKIEFNDIAADNNVDNTVDGRLDSVIQQLRADSVNVSVASPSYFNQSTLA